MKILNDIGAFLGTLTFADFIFFFAVLVLMVLIVTLIYFIKINNEIPEMDNQEETAEMRIVKEITKDISTDNLPNIDFTEYEKDQENKAIISYEELIGKTNNYEINYEKEELYDDLSVKKIDLEHLVSLKEDKAPKIDVRVISYAEEEAFLKTLKQLQKNLS
ncbi:MAG: hypothetical protein K2M17_04705 [Bacilli bacterium]|nr:hypothetical protein [Bacilli bacterium]